MPQHPCVLFQEGKVTNFPQAMHVYIAQFEEELRITRQIIREHGDPTGTGPSDIEEQRQAVEAIKQMVAQAQAIYDEAIQQAIGKMRSIGGPEMKYFADALAQNDYTGLSI